ncbi:MAG: hypothetical protein A2017_10465 [Lentisphaerae bacterium GWF2_44_16]|nr:MAG: hypothetical protein A2017_10465 [Lentisphaerae bacterium GWF2_44_16]
MLIMQVLIALFIRKKVMALTLRIQDIISEGSKRINRKIMSSQQKLAGNVKMMQKLVEKDQKEIISQAIEVVDTMDKYCKWNFLLKKQLDTMRMQFYFQIGEYSKVDQFIPKAMYMEPVSVAIKMVRQYKNNSPELDVTFKKKIRKFKGDKGIILYALYSWILVQKNEIDAAIKVLNMAKDQTDNETIHQNLNHLQNGKIKKFSNAAIGEEWYALKLEEPKYQIKQNTRRGF